ncbi:hypothetical protein K2X92_05385 [Candidatus Gracilibacteria bacterium]|nr:hypothetical protein [Candidatus Gracilibacteria bacterium]
MSTKLDNIWLPPETRIEGGGINNNEPIDYGSGEYRNLHTFWLKNPRAESETRNYRISPQGVELCKSDNIRLIRESYESWSQQKSSELMKITDGKNTITIDELLWYLRYEKQETIAGLLGETKNSNRELLLRGVSNKLMQPLTVTGSHKLIHAVQKCIKEICP